MAQPTRSRPRVKPARSCRLVTIDGHRTLSITVGSPPKQSTTYYHLAEVAVDWGRGFELRKFTTDGTDVYHVHFDHDAGDSCTCLGFIRWRRCKHRDGLAALMAAGRL